MPSTPPARALRAARAGAVSPLAVLALLTVLLAATLAARPADAQQLGLPVVQAPFPGRPLAIAVDAGGGGNGLSTAGLALGLHRGGSRLTAALGAGLVRGFATTRPAFGARVAYALAFGETGSLGAAPFVGFGAVSRGDSAKQANSTNGRPRLAGAITVIPAGVGLGYRRTLAGRPVAVHVTPQAQYWRLGAAADTAGAKSTSKVYLRAGVGVDAALTRQIGLALAYETGAASEVTGSGAAATGLAQGPRRSLLGVALSYAPRRSRR